MANNKYLSNEWLKQEYLRCNKEYFNNELPLDVKVEWSNRMTSRAGTCTTRFNRKVNKNSYRIALSTHYHDKYSDEIEDTLVHEMIHVKYPKNHHGELFRREMRRLNKEYGLNITVYSSGRAVVNYKYICKECGNVYERTNAISEYWLYKCSTCGGKLREEKLA